MLSQLPLFAGHSPLVVADGLGVDSTAMLLGYWQRGVRPDLILHADTGGEHPETIAYIRERERWLAEVGFPSLVVVRRRPVVGGKMGSYATLEQNCLVNKTLPSLAFGFRGCSLKWKREPQDKYVAAWAPAREAWAVGLKVRKAIGYDAGPKDARRSHLADDSRYAYEYPLRLWGWDRDRCIAEIRRAGLPVPRKSACFFCPAAKAHEIAELVERYPHLADRILQIEAASQGRLRTVQGLWRRAVKGRPATATRVGVEARPGSMTEYIVTLRARGAAEPSARPLQILAA